MKEAKEITVPASNVEMYGGKKLSKEEVSLIKEHIAKGASDSELKIFLAICQRTGLDPFSRQVYLVGRWDSKLGKEVRITQVGIDGFRAVAERSGKYAGSDDGIFGDDLQKSITVSGKTTEYKVPSTAKVTVYKIVEGVRCPFEATVRWDEYYPGDKQGFMWRSKPHVMLEKCAEAKALRKAFPMMLSGMYIPEELESSKDENHAPSSDFENTLLKLKQQDNIKTLEGYAKKFKKSAKYSDEEKAKVETVINERLAELKKSDANKK